MFLSTKTKLMQISKAGGERWQVSGDRDQGQKTVCRGTVLQTQPIEHRCGARVGEPLCDTFNHRLTCKSYYLRNTNNSFLSLSFFQTTDSAQTNTMVESFAHLAEWI